MRKWKRLFVVVWEYISSVSNTWKEVSHLLRRWGSCINGLGNYVGNQFFFFHCQYSPLWVLACRTMYFHFFLSATNSLHLLTPSTWGSLSTSSFHLFLRLPLLLFPSSSWVKIVLLDNYWINFVIISRLIFRRFSQNCEKRLLTSSCLSAWKNSARTGRIFMKFDIWVFSDNLSRKFKSH